MVLELDINSSRINKGMNAKNIKIVKCQYQATESSNADERLNRKKLNFARIIGEDSIIAIFNEINLLYV